MREKLFDAGVTAGVLVLLTLERTLAPAPVLVAGALMALALLARRRHPLPVLLTVYALAVAHLALRDTVRMFDVAVLIAMYAVVKYEPRPRWGILAGAGAGVGVLLAAASQQRQTGNFWTVLWVTGAVTVAVWFTAYGVRTRRLYIASLEERNATLERERAHRSLLAAADERAAIARELHDVIAHSLSVMIVQADGASYTLDPSATDARRALTTIAATGREALTDMRRVLTVLRGGTSPASVPAGAPPSSAPVGASPASVSAGAPPSSAPVGASPASVSAGARRFSALGSALPSFAAVAGFLRAAPAGGPRGAGEAPPGLGSVSPSSAAVAGFLPSAPAGGPPGAAEALPGGDGPGWGARCGDEVGRRRAGLAEVDVVSARAAEAGLRVVVERVGDLASLSPGEDLVAFRIVQESVTNALRHAGSGAAMTVRLDRSGDLLTITATDDGGHRDRPGPYRGAGPPTTAATTSTPAASNAAATTSTAATTGRRAGRSANARVSELSGISGSKIDAGEVRGSRTWDGGGHGLVGMRERVALHDGTFEAGPGEGGGWRVVAVLRLTPAAGASSGAAGLESPSGDAGLDGAPGVAGLGGPASVVGRGGASGASGAAGLDGAPGVAGLSGAAGLDGAPGVAGLSGAARLDGAPGMAGRGGAPGGAGLGGAASVAGLDGAVDVAGLDGAVDVAGLGGAVGGAGLDGAVGGAGLDGAVSVAGLDGAVGGAGLEGVPGDGAGAAGSAGAAGAAG